VELAAVRGGDRPIPPGLATSHPDWLVERWRRNFGEAMTDRLLAWNQGTPALYAHAPGDAPPPPDLVPAPWDGFYRLPGGLTPPIRRRLAEGLLTIRDPATRIAVDAVLGAAPRRVLDLCAAPGGKSRALLAAPRGPERVVAVDLPARTEELARNLEPWPGESRVVPADLDTGAGVPPEWTAAFDAVLLDAPCSNTGVLRRKPDAKQRLTPADLDRLPPIQGRLLRNAARFVRPGGVLVYGTCSLEPEENRDVVEAFLRAAGDDFRLETAVHALPPKTSHDGAGVFRLRKSGLR
jgi:16S rRNA (cytosine967-C5)-methyltransferase